MNYYVDGWLYKQPKYDYYKPLDGSDEAIDGKNVRVKVMATLEEVVVKRKVKVAFTRYLLCIQCEKKKCTACNAPYLREKNSPASGDPNCTGCHGTGIVGVKLNTDDACSTCNGHGMFAERVNKEHALHKDLIDSVSFQVVYKYWGSDGFGSGKRGDFILDVEVIPDERFKVDGKNLVADVEVPYLAQYFKTQIDWPVIGGVKRRPLIEGWKPGKQLYWRGLGGYARGDEKRGDIQYNIKLVGSDLEAKAAEKIAQLQEQLKSEAQRARDDAIRSLAGSLFPAVDGLEKARENMQGPELTDHRTGIELILELYREALAQHGIEPIKAEGERFDPSFHEAIALEEIAGVQKGMVTDEVQSGYTFNGALLRPSMVKVSG